VDEPLPVRVRATETALGRGRLYRRARARGVALQALRDNAFQRLRSALQLPAQAPPHAVAAEVAARVGAAPDVVQAILYGPDPQTDEELAAAVADLDALVAAALPAPPVPTGVEEPPDLARTEKEWS
jgi:hypothetical protein